MKKINIAIDGFSGCGKSTLARDLAQELGYIFIDTGAMFRAIAYLTTIRPNDSISTILESKPKIEFEKSNRVLLNGENVSKPIRSQKVTELVSTVAANSDVRSYLKTIQMKWIKAKGVVMEGRDITSVIMPGAELKLFVTAAPEVRAKRRYLQLKEQGKVVTESEVFDELQRRDAADTSRDIAPLVYVKSSILLDNTNLSRSEQLKAVVALTNPAINPEKYLGDIRIKPS